VVHEDEGANTVKIFVHFETQESAVQAYRDLNGRYFAGRQVEATFYDESRFLQGELSTSTSAE
jgi:splicing factor 45